MERHPFSALANTIGTWWTGLFWTGRSGPSTPPTPTDQAARPPHIPERRVARRGARRVSSPADAVRSWFRTGAP
jgi:hypothetical protein